MLEEGFEPSSPHGHEMFEFSKRERANNVITGHPPQSQPPRRVGKSAENLMNERVDSNWKIQRAHRLNARSRK